MEKNQKAMMITSIVLASCIIIAIVCYGIINSSNKDLKEDNSKEVAVLTNEDNSRKSLLSNMIKERYFEAEYVNEKNIKSFDITDLVEYGYYESKANIRYVQVNVKYSCVDGNDCVTYLVNKDNKTSYDGTFMVVLDNDEFVKFQKEEKYKKDSGFIETLDVIK